jgi:hypothetical protein
VDDFQMAGHHMDEFVSPGANPTTPIYNASAVNFYNATVSLPR